jgi:hypothetical protein
MADHDSKKTGRKCLTQQESRISHCGPSHHPRFDRCNNIRCTVPVTSYTLYNYQQYPVHSPCHKHCTQYDYQPYPVHSPCHKLHTVQLSPISDAQYLSQTAHCTIINNIRCTVPVTSSTLYNNLILPPPPPAPAQRSLPQSRFIGIKNQTEIITTLNAAQLLNWSVTCSAQYQSTLMQIYLPGTVHNYEEFRVCKSVHRHTLNWINQPDAANSQVYYLSLKYSSTCFGHPHAHHQELQQLM